MVTVKLLRRWHMWQLQLSQPIEYTNKIILLISLGKVENHLMIAKPLPIDIRNTSELKVT